MTPLAAHILRSHVCAVKEAPQTVAGTDRVIFQPVDVLALDLLDQSGMKLLAELSDAIGGK